MNPRPDHVILCFSQPSLAAREASALLAAMQTAGAAFGCPVQAIRLEGEGPGLGDALRTARDSGARTVQVQPVGFPTAANIMAWLPGAIAFWQENEGADIEVVLGEPPRPDALLPAVIDIARNGPAPQPASTFRPSLGKPGWQYLPRHDTHILVCTGPRCAFRGSGTLLSRLKARLGETGLSGRCLVTSTGCLFPCNQGPLIALYPRNAWYIVPDEHALGRIVEDVIGAGGEASDLRLAERPACRREPLSHSPDRSNR